MHHDRLLSAAVFDMLALIRRCVAQSSRKFSCATSLMSGNTEDRRPSLEIVYCYMARVIAHRKKGSMRDDDVGEQCSRPSNGDISAKLRAQ